MAVYSNNLLSTRGANSSMIWLGMYFVFNLVLTLYNKVILSLFQFPFPWTLTAIHTACGAVGSYIFWRCNVFSPAKLGRRENTIMIAFSALYTINIAISNVSLNLVTVPFHQVVRAMTPVFTIMLSVMFLSKSYSTMTYISLLPVVAGVAFATFGDYDYTAWGFFLTVLGTVLAAIKTVVTNRVQVGRLKLHPLDLLLRMSPLACAQTLVYSYASGEMEQVYRFYLTDFTWTLAFALLVNGIIAFFLNVVSFTANKKTSALTMTVAGNVKQVLSIVLAVIIFNLTITWTNALGILLTLAGGAWYTSVEMREKTTKRLTTSDTLLGNGQIKNSADHELTDVKTQR
ncbi:hypothetical protein INT45_005042 [Circinella minor]|uniref:Sugar phosphate transporter domain-containing protein n=1 Tax=Circinella minor TaxID=1195481 RepID=A0A8H7SCC8_9FUNG|nr:hypothetical protein INT45_005042 [Circinella minor]